jgi:hypothetical protein
MENWLTTSYFLFNLLFEYYVCKPAVTFMSIGPGVNLLSNVKNSLHTNRIGGVMVSVLASSAVDRGFEPRSGQTKDYKIGICCFSAKHAALRRKNKD